MSVDSNSLFLSREEILDELRSIEGADLDRFVADLAEQIKDHVDNSKSIGIKTGNDYLDSIGLSSDSNIDIIYQRNRLADFPVDMPLNNLLLLKDDSGGFIDPNSVDAFKKFWDGYVRDDDNYARTDIFSKDGSLVCRAGDFEDGFFRSINDLGDPKSMSEISIRLINVLDDGLRSDNRTLDLYKEYSNKGWTLSDLEANKEKLKTSEAFNSALDCIAYPGLYERTRSVFIASLNHRLNEFFAAKSNASDFKVTYSDLRRLANSCQKYAVTKAKESIEYDRINRDVDESFAILARSQISISRSIKRKIENEQKTHTQYGKTIRLDPNKPLKDQIKKIQDGYKPWVGKKLDDLESKGLVSIAAAAIAKRNGRDYVSGDDIDAARGAIASARKVVGEFNSAQDFLKRLAGPGNAEFAKKLSGYLRANAEKRQTFIGGVEGLATKLATYNRGQIPTPTQGLGRLQGHRELETNPDLAKAAVAAAASGQASRRIRTNADDRKIGQAVAATALLKAGGDIPTLKQVNASMGQFKLSVKAAQEQATKIRALNDGLAVRLGRQEALSQREAIQRDALARHHVSGGSIAGDEVVKGKVDPQTAVNIHKAFQQLGLTYKPKVAEPEAPKPTKDPDDKGPKL